jgi:ADP-ribosylation factor GTPase-activating protein 2/3
MYFGRGTYDPAASSEAQSRLKDFSGATAISSNAYFGREEEDEEEGGPSGGQGGDDLNDTLAGLERGVRDAAGRLMANPDVQNLTDQIRQGALKVSSIVHCGIRTDVQLSDYLSSYEQR